MERWARPCVAAARGKSRRDLLLAVLQRCESPTLPAVLQAHGLVDLATPVAGEHLPPVRHGVYPAAACALARTMYRARCSWSPLLGPDGGGLLGAVDSVDVEALFRRQHARAAKCLMKQVRLPPLHHGAVFDTS
jgi:hypothetical protein